MDGFLQLTGSLIKCLTHLFATVPVSIRIKLNETELFVIKQGTITNTTYVFLYQFVVYRE